MLAGEIISYAMNNLGLSELKGFQPQVLYARLRWVVRSLQDAQIQVEERVTVNTVAGQATYPLGKRNELESHQQFATAAGGIGTVPYIWTHYREGAQTVLMLAPVAKVRAGEQIIVRMSLAEEAAYDPTTEINIEESYGAVLRYRMCEQAAEQAAGFHLSRGVPAMTQQYRIEANRYRELAEDELRTVKRTHRSGFSHAEVKKFDTPSLPPTHE